MEDDHDHASQRSSSLGWRDTQFLRQGDRGKTKLRCGNNSRVESLRTFGKNETTGKHAPRKKSVSEGRRRKHGGSPKDSQVSNGKRGEEFEEEFGRKVRNVMGNSRGEQEKAVQKWSSEMQRAIQQQERRCEPRKRTIMEQEGSNS